MSGTKSVMLSVPMLTFIASALGYVYGENGLRIQWTINKINVIITSIWNVYITCITYNVLYPIKIEYDIG